MNLLSKVPQYWKAVIGFVAPAAGIIAMSVLPGSDGGSSITRAEWIGAVATAIITASGVAAKANAPKPPAAGEK